MNQWAKKTEGTTIVVSTNQRKSRSLLREGHSGTLTMTTADKVGGKKEDSSDKLNHETRTNKTGKTRYEESGCTGNHTTKERSNMLTSSVCWELREGGAPESRKV